MSWHPDSKECTGIGVLASTITALLVGGTTATSARAQEAEGQLEEITVTGSRIRQDDFTSATPTTVIDSEYLNSLGIVNLGQAMVQMPQNVNTNSPTGGDPASGAGPGGNFFNGSSIANLRGLNPFFGSRTLTLVDSRRHVPTNQGDGVDLNFVPTVIIDRMETVTGGASASYGSGAISGVQNILLDRDLDGIRAEVDYGRTAEGEGDDRHVGFAFGTQAGENGHFVVGVEGQNTEGIRGCAQLRDWCAQNFGTIDNPSFPDGENPQNVRRGNLREAWGSENGIFYIPSYGGRAPNTEAVVPLELTADGTGLQDYNTGVWSDGEPLPGSLAAGDANRVNAIGGDGDGIYDDTTLRSDIERETIFGAFTYDISDRLGFFADVSLGSVETFSPQDALTADGLCMQPDNAFIQGSPEIQALFDEPANLNCASIPGGAPDGILTKKNWDAQTNTSQATTTDLQRIAFGFDGQFADSTWVWDAYYQYGEADRVQRVNDNRHLQRYEFGFDAVIDPATGDPACRATVDPATIPPGTHPSLYEGCVPINALGNANLTDEAREWGFGALHENTVVEQEFVEFVASGDIAQGFGAGPVQMAAGASYREESIDNIARPTDMPHELRTDFLIQYGDSFSGDVDVTEVFAEVDIPLHETLNLNVAGRQSEYKNTAGPGTGVEGESFDYDMSTWKVAGTWDVHDALRIRVSESHDARAPNFRELYYRQFIHSGGVFGFCDNPFDNVAAPTDPCNFDLRGGLELTPEESDTTTFGFVVRPPNVNLQFAVDYFDIELNDSITPADTDLVLQSCEEGNAEFCDMIIGTEQPGFDPGNTIPCPDTCFSDIETVIATAFNYRSYNVEGLDFTADWIKQLENGTFNFRFLATRTFHQIVQTSTTNPDLTEDIAGVTGSPVGFLSDWASAPDLQANVTASWSRGDYTLTGQARWVSDGVNDPDMAGPNDPNYDITAEPGPNEDESVNANSVPSYAVYSLSGTYNIGLAGGRNVQLWGSINNLFDEEPPLVGGGVGGTQAIFFDTLGRQFRVGMRMSF